MATKKFVVIKNLHITMVNCGSSNKFEDNVMTVEYVPLQRYSTSRDAIFKKEEEVMTEKESFETTLSMELSTGQSSESSSLDKDIQAGTSMDTVSYLCVCKAFNVFLFAVFSKFRSLS